MLTIQILIVEDELENAIILENRLQAFGYAAPVIVSSGEAALQHAAETRPDLVLMDIWLSGVMDGIEAGQEIQRRFEIPVVYLTAHDDDETLQRAKLTEPYGYLLKPFSDRELRNAIELALYKHAMEKKLRECEKLSHDHLEDLVNARTAELTRLNEQLRQEIAERQRTEEALRRLETALETMLLGVTITDMTGTIVYTNPAEAAMHGYQVEELIGHDLGILAPSELRRPMTPAEIEMMEILVRESRNTRKDGSVFPVRLLSNVVKNADGAPSAIVTICEDITERKRAEDAFTKERTLLRTLIDHLPDCIFVKDVESRFVINNRAHLQALGATTQAAVVGKTDFDVFPPELAAHYYADEQEVLRSGQPLLNREEMTLDPAGGKHWLLTTKAPLRDQQGTVTGLVGISRDISEHKRAEEELAAYRHHLEQLVQERTAEFERANELLAWEITRRKRADGQTEAMAQRFQTAIETVEEGITLSNAAGDFEMFNSEMEHITGYTKAEVNHNQAFLALLYPDSGEHQKALAGIQEVVCAGKCRDVETTIRAKDGTRKTLLVSTSLVPSQEGQYFLSAYHDITDRKRAEVDLQQAKDAAEAANAAKSEFLANMSHELRTPLNAILGYAQILKYENRLTEKQRNAIDVIYRSGEHLLLMINDILDLSKIEAHKLELGAADFRFPAFLQSVVEIAQIRAQQREIGFEYNFNAALPQVVRGDEKRLRQILLNLLSNAIKFTKQGKVSLRVFKLDEFNTCDNSATQQLSNSKTQKLRFEVEDTGIGIPEQQLDAIFLPFHQVRGDEGYAEGTGLGLAISQTLVRLMGGELQVKSVVAQGSAFWFDIPLPEVDGAPAQLVQTVPAGQRVIGFRGERRKVLIADDQEANRTLLKEILAPLGFDIAEAANGRAAFDKTLAFHPDLLLLDLVMPGLDGFEVIRQIRRIPTLGDVVVIAVSASAFEQTRQESLASGCADFLAKPIQLRELLEKIRRHLSVEWIYETMAGYAAADPSTETGNLVLPGQDELRRFFTLVEKGHLQKILAQLDQLEQSNPQMFPFTTKMRRLAKNFQMDAMATFLTQCLQGG